MCSLCFLERKNNGNQTLSLCSPYSPCFSEWQTVFKIYNQTSPNLLIVFFVNCEPVWFLFLKTIFKTVFINTKNTIFVFSENHSCYLNLVFYVFSLFFGTKKKKKKSWEPNIFSMFSLFSEQKTVFKNCKQIGSVILISIDSY